MMIHDEPLTDNDYQFIQRYGLHCWKEAIRLDGVNHASNGDRDSVAKCESQIHDNEDILQTNGG